MTGLNVLHGDLLEGSMLKKDRIGVRGYTAGERHVAL